MPHYELFSPWFKEKKLIEKDQRAKNIGRNDDPFLIIKKVKIKWDSIDLLCILAPQNSLKVIRQEIITETERL